MTKLWERTWPVLLVILTPFLWIGQKCLQLYVRTYIRFFGLRVVSSKAPCPACGIRKEHKILYDRMFERVIHTCVRCGAMFPEMPVRDTKKWQIVAEPVSIQEQHEKILLKRELPWAEDKLIVEEKPKIEITTRVIN